MPLGTNLLAPPWHASGVGILGGSTENARACASSLSKRRSWLPVNGSAEQQMQIPRQRSHPPISSKSLDVPPGLPLTQHGVRIRSYTEESNITCSPSTPANFLEVAPLPDMSERQKKIQRSIFKVLGQHE